MSAYGYKRTFTHTVIYVRFTPESGHSHGSRKRSAYAYDAVDGSHPTASQCANVWLVQPLGREPPMSEVAT